MSIDSRGRHGGKAAVLRRGIVGLIAAGALLLGVPTARLVLAQPAPAPAAAPPATPDTAASSASDPAIAPTASDPGVPPVAPDAGAPPSRYGTLHLLPPEGDMRGFVILFSHGDGWTTDDQQAASRLAAAGAFVAGVDTGYYLSHIDTAPDACDLMDGDAETIAHQIQRARGTGHYFTPILAAPVPAAR
jgi:hypothetical protein